MTAEQLTGSGPEATPEPGVRKLYRSSQNRVLAGVCGGIAEYYGSDPTAVRLAALVIGLFTGIVPMVILYLIAAIVVPERGTGEIGARVAVGGGTGSAAIIFGAILIFLGIVGFANEWLRVDWDLAWPFVLIGLGVIVVAFSARRR